jgi:uncharacterized membrane protein
MDIEFVKRFPFLDWMRGLALVIMIQCHVFNSFARMDVRGGGVYALSQFAGGMAGPLFLFMAGMTFAFQMEGLDGRQALPWRRWLACLRRAGYILGAAFLIRITNWVTSWPHTGWREIIRVDILNSMGLAMAVFSLAAWLDGGPRVRAVLLAAIVIAAASPLVANLNWSGAPTLVQEYLSPGFGRGHFPFFPCASYVGFGMTAGAAVRRTGSDRMDRLMQWAALFGGVLILGGQYVSNLPYAVYPKSNFWTDNPTLIFIRVGISLVMLAGAHLWTGYCVGSGWSWMKCLGRNSLMVYWVHLMLVYGAVTGPLQRALPVPLAVLATVAVTAAMVALSALWLWWKGRWAVRRGAASCQSPTDSIAPSPPLPG